MKGCDILKKPETKNELWKKCIEPVRPKLSIYQYCEAQLQNPVEKKRCKFDMCSMCCITSSNVFHVTEYSEKIINQCKISCITAFKDENDEIIY